MKKHENNLFLSNKCNRDRFLWSRKNFWAFPLNKKDDYFSPQTHVNLIPMSTGTKFCLESDFIGPNPAISRNLVKYWIFKGRPGSYFEDFTLEIEFLLKKLISRNFFLIFFREIDFVLDFFWFYGSLWKKPASSSSCTCYVK